MKKIKLPYPEEKGQTHYDGCWARPFHHNCAVAKVIEQDQMIQDLREQIEDLQAELDERD